MRIVKFQGANMRDALAKVKRELGSDAIVVSTRPIRRGLRRAGVEVSAAVDHDPPVLPARAEGQAKSPGTGAAAPPSLAADDVDKIVAPLRSELRWLRSMMKSSAEARTDSAVRAELRAVRRLLEDSRSGVVAPDPEELVRQHRVTSPTTGRIVALVGPTGVGKTTTIAKLAARAALVRDLRVGIVTLDNFRIGGEEQIRIFAELIGVPLRVAKTPTELCTRVEELESCDLIFIDTAGRSPRDTAAIRALRRALGSITDVEVHLTMAASTSARLIDSIFRRYRAIGIARLLFTKLDEADDLAELVRAPARLSTPVAYATVGQAVPEDLVEATDAILLRLASQGFDTRAFDHDQAA